MVWWNDGHPLYDFAQPTRPRATSSSPTRPSAAFLLRPLAWRAGHGRRCCSTPWSRSPRSPPRWWWLFALSVGRLADTGSRSGSASARPPVEPIRLGYDFGQINLVLWALIVPTWPYSRPGAAGFLGVGIGLATAIKLIPGIFILYLLVSRRYRAALTAIATAATATVLTALAAPNEAWGHGPRKVRNGEGRRPGRRTS